VCIKALGSHDLLRRGRQIHPTIDDVSLDLLVECCR
jgi:hypothetical protein